MKRLRLIVATALLLATVQGGQASLETDCYFEGGYFDSTYFGDNYFKEINCATPPSLVASTVSSLHNLFHFPGIWGAGSSGDAVPSTLLDGLQEAWSFNEATNAARIGLINSWSFDNTGTTTQIDAKVGKGFTVNITSPPNGLTLTDSSSLDFFHTGDWTIAFWFRIDATGAARNIVGQHEAGQRSWKIEKSSSEVLQFWVASDIDGLTAVSHGTTLVQGTWYFCIADHDDGTSISLDINNISKVTGGGSTGGVQASTADLKIGKSVLGTNQGFGAYDQFFMWNRLLTSDEGTELYNGGSGVAYPF